MKVGDELGRVRDVLYGFPAGRIGRVFVAFPLDKVAKTVRPAAAIEPNVQDAGDLIFVGVVDLNGWWGVDDAIRDRRSLFGLEEVRVEDIVDATKAKGKA